MLRVVGAGLIACSVTGMGIWITVREKRRVRALEQAMHAVSLLKSVITRQLIPLKEAVHMLSDQNTLLRHLDTAEWGENDLRRYGLGEEESRILETLFYEIPRAGAGNTEHFDAAQDRLTEQLIMRKKTADQASALYPKLSVLCGAAAFLMLL